MKPDHFQFVMVVFQLPGVEACAGYTFRYGRNPLMELPLAINPSGCARSEPKACTHVKRCVLRYSVGLKPFITLCFFCCTFFFFLPMSWKQLFQVLHGLQHLSPGPQACSFFFSKDNINSGWQCNVFIRVFGLACSDSDPSDAGRDVIYDESVENDMLSE